MAFTYDDTLSTNLAKVRYHIQDTEELAGPKPADANFTDNELNGLITAEGSWQRAVAGAFETLAAAWQRSVTFRADGLSINRSDIAKGYRDQAAEWRITYGRGGGAGSRSVTRVDGYSSDKTNTDV